MQGSAADIIKLAMPRPMHRKSRRQLNARLILQIHDELVLEAPLETAKQAGLCLAAIMAGATPGGVPLPAPLTVDWGGPQSGARRISYSAIKRAITTE